MEFKLVSHSHVCLDTTVFPLLNLMRGCINPKKDGIQKELKRMCWWKIAPYRKTHFGVSEPPKNVYGGGCKPLIQKECLLSRSLARGKPLFFGIWIFLVAYEPQSIVEHKTQGCQGTYFHYKWVKNAKTSKISSKSSFPTVAYHILKSKNVFDSYLVGDYYFVI